MRKLLVLSAAAALTVSIGTLSAAQASNPRFGKWKLKSDAPPPSSNIMTYEPFNGTGMKVTIDAVSRDGAKSQWFYTTMFDGKDEPVTGNPGSDTAAVRVINDRINEIVYKKGGKITQVLTNVISADGSIIGVMYMRPGADGKSTVSFATYEKMP
jgi:hypothetical protein